MTGNSKKLIAYAAAIIILLCASVVTFAVMTTRDVIRNPGDFVSRPVASTASRLGEDFSMPPAGAEGRMNASELAWMLRERIVMDVMEPFAMRGPALESYNERVRAYNDRARAIAYVDSDMNAAKRMVEERKGEIVRETINAALKLSMPPDVSGDESSQRLWTVQMLLRALAIYPDEPSGRESDGTAYAIKSYETAIGLPPTGTVDDALVSRLIETCAAKLAPADVGFDSGK
ncbi:MAG: peptidoglycan-binding protein [Synergistaceae bacterium]|jgi:hypothetical protein|nr:peptidoglycan-binding protein [Synergistaceae bacterium]